MIRATEASLKPWGVCLAAAGLLAVSGEIAVAQEAELPAEETPVNTGALSLSAGVDFANMYFFRGILQEDNGLISQPWAELGISLSTWENGSLSATVGMWNSFHDRETGSSTDDHFISKWYESDLYAGLAVEFGKFTIGTTFTFYTSPNDAFETVNELSFSVGYDDSELLGAFALAPSATIAFEIGDDGAADGQDHGVYLQLDVSPGYTWENTSLGDISFSVPVTLGLSLDNYYQDADGDDETFGFLSVGVSAGIALPMPKEYGSWELGAGVSYLVLGDNAAAFNNEDDDEVIFTIGLSISY